MRTEAFVPNLRALPSRTANDGVRVVVESPRGSQVKLTYQSEADAFVVSRELVAGLAFPHDFGFIPNTLAEDGDPLDAMVLSDCATFPGAVHEARVIGAIQLSEPAPRKGQPRIENGRLIVVPADEPHYADIQEPRDLGKRRRDELVRFFLAAVGFAKKDVRFEAWIGARAAMKVLARCERAARE